VHLTELYDNTANDDNNNLPA